MKCNIAVNGIRLALLVLFTVVSLRSQTRLVAGSYTGDKPGAGVCVFDFDTVSGRLIKNAELNDIVNPSFVCMPGPGDHFYVCAESRLKGRGSLCRIASSGSGLKLAEKKETGFENPVYLSVPSDRRYLFAVTYTQPALLVYPLDGDGKLQPATQTFTFAGSGSLHSRQETAHPHAAVLSPDEKFLYVPDLGADKIRVFRYHQNRGFVLIPYQDLDVQCNPGSGPRHLRFHPSGRFAYCSEELSGTVSGYSYNNGKLELLQQVPCARDQGGQKSSSDLQVSPDGRHLYVGNRMENTITVFDVDRETGKLLHPRYYDCGGEVPRSLSIHRSGRWLLVANQGSDRISVFSRSENGALDACRYSGDMKTPSSLVFFER